MLIMKFRDHLNHLIQAKFCKDHYRQDIILLLPNFNQADLILKVNHCINFLYFILGRFKKSLL